MGALRCTLGAAACMETSLGDLERLFKHRAIELKAEHTETVEDPRLIASRYEASLNLAHLADACSFEHENVLHHHAVIFNAEHLGDVHHLPGAVLHARYLQHDFHGTGKLLQNHTCWNLDVGHQDHRFQPAE